MRESAATKARRYLAEGRVIVTALDAHRVEAVVRGDAVLHSCSYHAGAWACSCEARGRCSHLLAVGLIVAVDLPGRSLG